ALLNILIARYVNQHRVMHGDLLSCAPRGAGDEEREHRVSNRDGNVWLWNPLLLVPVGHPVGVVVDLPEDRQSGPFLRFVSLVVVNLIDTGRDPKAHDPRWPKVV